MTVRWFNSEQPKNKFAPNLKIPLYKGIEGSNEFIDKLITQLLKFEEQIIKEELVSEVPKHSGDPYLYTQHWKQHNLFWDKNAKGGDQLERFPMSKELEKLFHIFRKQYLLFLKEVNYPRVKCYIHGWGNVLRKGQWISKHFHMADATSYISGTYYLTTVPTFLELSSPIRTDHVEQIPTTAGHLVMFPSWVPHESTVYEGDEYRISLAFDLSMEVNIKSNPWRPHHLFDDPDTMEGLEMYLKDRSLTA